MKLLTLSSLLLPAALFGGCAALPGDPYAYGDSGYYAPQVASNGAPAYYDTPGYYETPGYYPAPAYYDPPVVYGPSLGFSVYGGSRGGGDWNRGRIANGGYAQDRFASRSPGWQGNASRAAERPEARLSRGAPVQAQVARAVVPQATRAAMPQPSRAIAPQQMSRGAGAQQNHSWRGNDQGRRGHDRG